MPEGAEVLIDGAPKGVSPLSLELEPGEYEVDVRSAGYAAVSDTITLEAGQEAIYAPELADISPPEVSFTADRTEVAWSDSVTLTALASDNSGSARLELLLGDESLAVIDEGAYSTTFSPAGTPGMAPGGEYVLKARATDLSGNAGEATVTLRVAVVAEEAPTATPAPERGELTVAATAQPDAETPVPTAAPADIVHYEVEEAILPTYPYAPHISETTDPLLGGYPVRVLDRAAYDAAAPVPQPARYRLLILENRYLRLTFLPDLGGRLYGVTFKPTGSEELYQNAVVKPTEWGPPSPPYPAGANWWLAAGGMEWGFPVEEHGYEYGTVWGFDNVTTPEGGVMVSLFTREPGRPHVVVDITLEPDQSFFIVRIRIVNPWSEAFRLKWWHSAALAPGPQNTVGEGTRFIWPAERARVHSAGDPALPSAGQEFDWPIYAGRDLSRLGEWTTYLGVFESPAAQGGYAAVYDTSSDEGMVRSYPPETARGAKFYSSGWQQPLDPALWTDDGTRYAEMQGGLMPTYDEWYELAPGGEVGWTETWYPVAGIGGVTHAEEAGALRVEAQGKELTLGLFLTQPTAGRLTVSLDGAEIMSLPVAAAPERPFLQVFEYTGADVNDGEVVVTLSDLDGAKVLEYRGKITLR
jgi:hypothetical protein